MGGQLDMDTKLQDGGAIPQTAEIAVSRRAQDTSLSHPCVSPKALNMPTTGLGASPDGGGVANSAVENIVEAKGMGDAEDFVLLDGDGAKSGPSVVTPTTASSLMGMAQRDAVARNLSAITPREDPAAAPPASSSQQEAPRIPGTDRIAGPHARPVQPAGPAASGAPAAVSAAAVTPLSLALSQSGGAVAPGGGRPSASVAGPAGQGAGALATSGGAAARRSAGRKPAVPQPGQRGSGNSRWEYVADLILVGLLLGGVLFMLGCIAYTEFSRSREDQRLAGLWRQSQEVPGAKPGGVWVHLDPPQPAFNQTQGAGDKDTPGKETPPLPDDFGGGGWGESCPSGPWKTHLKQLWESRIKLEPEAAAETTHAFWGWVNSLEDDPQGHAGTTLGPAGPVVATAYKLWELGSDAAQGMWTSLHQALRPILGEPASVQVEQLKAEVAKELRGRDEQIDALWEELRKLYSALETRTLKEVVGHNDTSTAADSPDRDSSTLEQRIGLSAGILAQKLNQEHKMWSPEGFFGITFWMSVFGITAICAPCFGGTTTRVPPAH